MRPITVTVGNQTVAASATAIRTALPLTSSGDLVLDGAAVVNGVATLEADRNLLMTFFTVTEPDFAVTIEGMNSAGRAVSETITTNYLLLGSGTFLTTNQYRKVYKVRSNKGSAGGTLSIGTSATGTSPWVAFDPWSPGTIAIQANVVGTANYTVQSTLDNPNDVNSPYYNNPLGPVWVSSSDTVAVGASAGIQSNFLFVPQFARILLNSGTGLVTATFMQSGAS